MRAAPADAGAGLFRAQGLLRRCLRLGRCPAPDLPAPPQAGLFLPPSRYACCVPQVYRVDARAGTLRYRLRSMVCYYGQHYQALVLVPEAGGWLMFDDTRVARVGGWAEVLRKCEAGRIQPSVLFYEAEGAV